MNAVVSISQDGSVDEKIKNAIDLLGGTQSLVRGNHVLIKPNLGPWAAYRNT